MKYPGWHNRSPGVPSTFHAFQMPNFTAIRFGFGLLMALGSGTAVAQNPTWTSAQSLRNAESLKYSLSVAGDGSQYVTGTYTGTLVLDGTSLTAGAGAGHVFLAKYSAAGAVLWTAQLDSPNTLNSKLAVDAAGNVYLAGGFTTTLTLGAATLSASGAGVEPYVVKYNPQGVVQWSRQGGGPGSVNSIATGPGGDLALTGSFTASIGFGGVPLAGGGAYYCKLSATGSVLQAVQMTNRIYLAAVALDTAGNAYLTGQFSGNVTIGSIALTDRGRTDALLCKINPAGNVVWAVSDGTDADDIGTGVIVDAGGNPVVGGTFTNRFQSGPQWREIAMPYVARYTSQGSLMWKKTFPIFSGGPGGTIQAVAHDGRGGYLVAGSLYGSLTINNTQISSYLTANGLVMRFDDQGTISWYAMSGAAAPDFSGAYFNIYSIAADAVGKVFVQGMTHSTGTVAFGGLPRVGQGMVLAQLQPGTVLATRSVSAAGSLVAYPNPATGSVTLMLPAGGGYLTMLDALGRIVREKQLPTASEYALPLDGLAPGLYQLCVKLQSGQTAHSQLAVQ